MEDAIKNLATALRLAERAHAQAELAGHKGEWPEFYSRWLIEHTHLWAMQECGDGSCEVHIHD